MPIMERLGARQIHECLAETICREAPVVLTCRIGDQWYNCHAKILRQADDKLWLECPTSAQEPVPEIAVGLPIGLSFKLRHHKHVFNAVVEAVGPFRLDDGPELHALCVSKPAGMQRIQRRAYNRVEVPRNRSALATFWWGGLAGSPDEPAARGLTWEGWITNISAGGFQVRTAGQGSPALEVADLVGVRIDLGQDFETVLADAQFRQESRDERGMTLMGFQFVGLNESAEGRETLRRIGKIVCEFQRLQGRRHASSVA